MRVVNALITFFVCFTFLPSLHADLSDRALEESLLNSPKYATLVDGSRVDSGACEISFKKNGFLIKPQIRNTSDRPLELAEVILADVEHHLPADTAFYGEGFTMLSLTGGTLGNFIDIGGYTDHDHYKLPQPEGYRAVYGVMTLRPPGDEHTFLAGFTSCRRFVGKFYINADRLRIAVNTEGLTLPPGETWDLEELRITKGKRDAVLTILAHRIRENHPPLSSQELPTGWCSWYCFGPRVIAENITENLAVIDKRVPELRYIQIDDGYQPWMGDWLETGKAFGGGVQHVLAKIKQQGFEPAIWVAPFIASPESKLFTEHPNWFVKDSQGEPLRSDKFTFGGWRWGPWYILDGTHPEAQKYLEQVFRTMREEWGCTYFKLDANAWGAFPEGIRHDPNASSVEAYRNGMAAVRRGAGDAFLLGCNHALWPSLGEIHGSRSSRDISRNWKTISGAARENLMRNWQNNYLWWNDPDCLLLSGNLPENEKSFHSAATYATGGMLLSGDDVTKATDRQFEILKTLAQNPGEAAEFTDETLTEGWMKSYDYDTVVLLNWTEKASSRELSFGGKHRIVDLISGEALGIHKDNFAVALPARSGRVLRLVYVE